MSHNRRVKNEKQKLVGKILVDYSTNGNRNRNSCFNLSHIMQKAGEKKEKEYTDASYLATI